MGDVANNVILDVKNWERTNAFIVQKLECIRQRLIAAVCGQPPSMLQYVANLLDRHDRGRANLQVFDLLLIQTI